MSVKSALAIINDVISNLEDEKASCKKDDYVEWPLIDSHLGIWEGTYRYYNADGELTKSHESKLTLNRVGNNWIQKNEYFNKETNFNMTLDFTATFCYENGAPCLIFNTGRVTGKSWQSGDAILLDMHFKDESMPDDAFETIIRIKNSNSRLRTWQQSNKGKPAGFVQIIETQKEQYQPKKNSI